MTFAIAIERAGYYGLFTEHHPREFDLALDGPGQSCLPLVEREFKPPHEHDDEVTSVGINLPGDLDLKKLNGWLSNLLRFQGPDIYRMKGVLAIQGFDERYVIQGVHALFEGAVDRPWRQGEARGSKLVFIGKDLREEELRDAMRSCLTPLNQAASR